MIIVELFGIYVWLISIISENNKLDKCQAVKNHTLPNICLGPFADFFIYFLFSYLYIFVLLC